MASLETLSTPLVASQEEKAVSKVSRTLILSILHWGFSSVLLFMLTLPFSGMTGAPCLYHVNPVTPGDPSASHRNFRDPPASRVVLRRGRIITRDFFLISRELESS